MVDKKNTLTPEEVDDLRKSLKDLEYTDQEIDDMINAQIQKSEDKEEEEKEEAEEDDDTPVDADEMKKAYDDIKKMKSDMDKAMGSFLDRFGKVPGFTTPTFDVKNKAMEDDIQKSFDSKFIDISKSFEAQTQVNESILKSLEAVQATVNKIAEAPNPLKGIFGDYSRSVIEKGESFNKDGKQVISLKDKKGVQDVLIKSLDVVQEDQKQKIRDEISNFTVTNKLDPRSLNIVSKAMNVEFEK